ncbi:Protein NRD1 [Wickerhamiella sorbophila]|uniref:Protein NRD1 n=1 Tax=Wickerhamiella sorbophila TaxID=45607 RepID=A0A2T0FCI4_9ASCO|nr:Protein NRD1 [Wickerhamiella sorbophila]PRT52691.1 Protein NRD1 [Wickerhamiella sorbophila]
MEEFSQLLDELLHQRAPGVSGSRIKRLAAIAYEHPELESAVVQKLYSHIKKTPTSHKLGALYAVEAVARAYKDNSKDPNKGIQFTDGLKNLSDVLQPIFDSLAVRQQSSDASEKMRKVLDLWTRAETFDVGMIDAIRDKHFTSTTPPGSPPATWAGLPAEILHGPELKLPKAEPKADAASILETLANLAKTKESVASPVPQQAALAQSASATTSGEPSLLATLLAQTSKSTPAPQPKSSSRGRGSSRDPRLAMNRDRSRSPGLPSRTEKRDRDSDSDRDDSPRPPKNVSFDPTLVPMDAICVLSRTLFVGGIPPGYDEAAAKGIIEEFVPVQSVIYHPQKHHAFIKVYTRADAENVKSKLDERARQTSTMVRAKWGVGYGPRDCFDYSKGLSIIPLSRLTEAGRRWAKTARHGGTDGTLEAGQVMEEPDIIIGTGAASSSSHTQAPQARRPVQQVSHPSAGYVPPAGAQSTPQMPGMPGMPMPGMPMPGMPGMPMPGMPGMPIPGMPGMPFPMMPMMPPGGDMQAFFAQMQQPKKE